MKISKILATLMLAIIPFNSIASATDFSRNDFGQYLRNDTQKLETEETKERESWINRILRNNRSAIDSERRLEKEETKECSSEFLPELSIKNLNLSNVSKKSNGDLEYAFDIEIQNFSEKEFGPLNAEQMYISVFDMSAANNDQNFLNLSYGDLLEKYEISNYKVASGPAKLKLDCNKSVTLKNINFTFPKNMKGKEIAFMLDSHNEIQEINDVNGQNAETNAATNASDFHKYSINQAYNSLQINTNDYDLTTKEISFNTSIPNYLSKLEEELKNEGYKFDLQVWDYNGEDFFDENQDLNLIEETEYALNYLKGYPNQNLNLSNSTLISETSMSGSGQINSDGAITMNSTSKQFLLLNLVTPEGEKLPVYAIKPIDLSENKPSAIINCNYQNNECNQLVLTRKSASFIKIDNPSEISETSPLLASRFEVCNQSSSFATIKGVQFRNQYASKYDDIYKNSTHEFTTEYFIGENSIWAPEVNKIEGSRFESTTKDFKLGSNPLLLAPEQCETIDVKINAADEAISYYLAEITGIDSSIPAYFNNGEKSLIESFNGNINARLLGTKVILNSAYNGALVKMPNWHKANNYPTQTEGNFTAYQMAITTDINQFLDFEHLEFAVQSNYSGNLNASIEIMQSFTVFDEKPKKITKLMQIPANGTFQLSSDELGGQLEFGQEFQVKIGILGSIEEAGDVTISLSNIATEDAQLSFSNSFWLKIPLETKVKQNMYSKELILPLKNQVFFVNSDKGLHIEYNFGPINQWGFNSWHSKFNPSSLLYTASINTQLPEIDEEDVVDYWIDFTNMDFLFEGDFAAIDLRFDIKNGDIFIDQLYKTISPDETVSLEMPNVSLGNNQNIIVEIHIENYPDLEALDVDTLYVTPMPIEAYVSIGEEAPVYALLKQKDDDGDWVWGLQEFLEPIYDAQFYSIGEELLYLKSENNSPSLKIQKIELLEENEKVILNSTCFSSIGQTTVYSIKYNHDEHDFQPFEKVVLNIWGDDILLPLEGWSATEALFIPSKPITLSHDQSMCLTLQVYGPTMPLNNAFFDLIEIEAVVENTNVEIPIIQNKNS
ncbi:hypothetical protein JKY72_00865, partial [Candidatus Gracilibacteria bacterium]|nr:hypothetical protein [Candidatus Gracilibacteria bacterium]